MSQHDKLVGGVGVVRVGDLEITVTPLAMVEERALRRLLLDRAAASATDYYTRCAKLLAAMKSQPVAYVEAVREITRLTALGPAVSEAQFDEYRDSPAGVAAELFARGRKATPGLTADGLAAAVTAANADDVADQMRRAVEGDGPNG